jgi:hypothetical protein
MRKTISRKVLAPQPQELYKIKIGGRGKERTTASGDKSYIPEKYDHFIVTRTARGGAKDNFLRATEIHAEVGDKPTELDITLAGETVEDNFQSELCRYEGQTKVWTCDGESAINLATGVEVPCQRQARGAKCCKPYARFSCILEAAPTVGGFAYYRTTGWKSTNNLQTTLEFFYKMFGTLQGLPLRLVCYPSTDQYTEGGKSKTSTSHKVAIVLRAGLREAIAAAEESLTMLAHHREKVKLLTAGRIEVLDAQDVIEAEEIQQEFFPDPDVITSIHTQDKIDALKEGLGLTTDTTSPVIDAEIEDEDEDEVAEPEPEEVLSAADQKRIEEVRGLMDQASLLGVLDADGAAFIEAAIDKGDLATVTKSIKRLKTKISAGGE